MAHRRASIKKIRVDKRRREQNIRVISELKTFTRKFNVLMAEKKAEEAVKEASNLFSKVDKAVKKGLLHKNVASRRKSRIHLRLNALKASKKA